GIPIDPQVWAYFCCTFEPARRRFASALRALSEGQNPTNAQIYRLVQQILLDSCVDSCPECLSDRNNFCDLKPASRSIAAHWFAMAVQRIEVATDRDWRGTVGDVLRASGRGEITCGRWPAAE